MKHIISLLILMHVGPALAELDEHQRKGLDDTKAFLKNKGERDAFIRKDKAAQEADAKVDALSGGGANKEEIYGISAEVMERLTQDASGDPEKMQIILQEAQKNPEAFYNKYFDSNAKARVRGVAGKIEGQKTPVGGPK